MAGYSGTPLPKKLGIKPGSRLGLVGAPDDFAETLGELPDGVRVARAARDKDQFDVIVCFARSSKELARELPALPARLHPGGGLWIAWPKKSAKKSARKSAKKSAALTTDLAEAGVRARGLATGLVDNKVCAIDDTWSGLRFVVRLAARPREQTRPRG
jgi:hypothetical protein